jgi:hypothetical protein
VTRRSSADQLVDTSRKSTTVALMTKAVRFDSYDGLDVLEVRDVPRPVPGAGEVRVEVRAATWRGRWPNSVPASPVSLWAMRCRVPNRPRPAGLI